MKIYLPIFSVSVRICFNSAAPVSEWSDKFRSIFESFILLLKCHSRRVVSHIPLRRYRISRGRRGISFRRCDCFPLVMHHLLYRCASPTLTSTSPVGGAASPNCGICDTTVSEAEQSFRTT